MVMVGARQDMRRHTENGTRHSNGCEHDSSSVYVAGAVCGGQQESPGEGNDAGDETGFHSQTSLMQEITYPLCRAPNRPALHKIGQYPERFRGR
jgi:hypothetical protein